MPKIELRKGGEHKVVFHATDKNQIASVVDGLSMAAKHVDCKESAAAVEALQKVRAKYGMIETKTNETPAANEPDKTETAAKK